MFEWNICFLLVVNLLHYHQPVKLGYGMQWLNIGKLKMLYQLHHLIQLVHFYYLVVIMVQYIILVKIICWHYNYVCFCFGLSYNLIIFLDMQKFPLRMKDNDLLVTELYRDPSNDPITAISVYLTPKTSKSLVFM